MTTRAQQRPALPRFVGVDLLRGFAVAAVLGRHWQNAKLAEPGNAAIDRLASEIFRHGVWGVTLFFVISGFLITRTTMAREPNFFALSFRGFYTRRVARIFPLLAASIGIGVIGLEFGAGSDLYGYVFHDPGAEFDPPFWLSIATFTFNWLRIIHAGSGGGWGLHWDVLWSLAVEEQFYLIFPVVVWLARSSTRLMQLMLYAITLAILTRGFVMVTDLNSDVAYIASFACLDALSLGVLVALLVDRLEFGKFTRRSLMMVGMAMIGTVYFPANIVIAPFVLALGAALFILGAQSRGAFAARLWRPFARIGALSYGIYLLHPAVLYALAPLLRRTDLVAGYIAYLIATVAIAELVYRCLERPANAWVRALANAWWGEPQRGSAQPKSSFTLP
jgi:peptidoglycan/LPS O-acetylase OafA/YrhL